MMNKTEELKSIRKSQQSIWTTWKISVQKLLEKSSTVLRAMAILDQGGIGEVIVNKILKLATAYGDSNVKGTFRKVIVNKIMHDSSLIGTRKTEKRFAFIGCIDSWDSSF